MKLNELYGANVQIKCVVRNEKKLDEYIKAHPNVEVIIQDIIDVSHRRNLGVDIVLYPVKVQGVGAEIEIANGINFFSQYDDVEVVIVARGGGSMEDLQPFNTEIVATATYNCSKPIVSAVGHETDFTIIDFVADLRAPTPSAAAELVVNKIEDDLFVINNCVHRAMLALDGRIDNIYSNGDNLLSKINYVITNMVSANCSKIDFIDNKIGLLMQSKTQKAIHEFELINNKLESLNPIIPLQKGYVKVEDDEGVKKFKTNYYWQKL